MSGAGEPKFLSQAEFARRRGVSRKAVTVWKFKGLLVLDEDGRVNVEETEWKLDDRPAKYRGGVTHRPIRASGNKPAGNSAGERRGRLPHDEARTLVGERGDRGRPAEADTGGADGRRPGRRVSEGANQDAPPEFDLDAEDLSLAEAVRRKENFLGLLRKRELEISNGEWVRVEEVGAQVEHEYATVRERMLTIPGKIASVLVGADRDVIEATIRREVTEALNELHDPAGIAGRLAASEPAPESEAGS